MDYFAPGDLLHDLFKRMSDNFIARTDVLTRNQRQ